ncbi:hypothetical protein PMKS-001766 [Pichia membranifaciens]|uniref:SH3 domain-containing protein n=1 Tax=Pichia membranifaciens TaxID=4926 RepID=A0A1Q2YFP2_9ASCO|nr:hypothetical protein PMKS-001766 [Pichia membranifaciens]
MSASINRSLTTIKTELEFLLESEVISETLYDHIIASLPERYVKGMPMKEYSGSVTSTTTATPAGNTTSSTTFDPPSIARRTSVSSTSKGEYAEAIYDYAPQQSDDLRLSRGDKITVLEKVSDAWWKGSVNGRSGMFPANYVKLYSAPSDDSRSAVNVAPPPSYQQSQPFYQQQQQQPYYQQQMQQPYYQQSQSTLNIPGQIPVGQPPVQQQPQQQQGQHSGSFKRFGSKLGDAAIFGAGATIGSDLINSIF